MITDLLPLLAFSAVVVIARNVFEAYVLDREQHRFEVREPVRVRRSQSHQEGRVVGSRDHATR